MTHTPEILEKLFTLIEDKFPEPESQQIKHFVQHFYHAVAPEDIHPNITHLYGAALDYWHFAHQYTQTKVRVYNPQIEQYGWQSPHTIVSILTKDMPFLIDTIRMALNRQGLTVHLIIYPVIPVERDEQGQLRQVLPYQTPNANYESIIHIEIDKQTATLESIAHQLKTVLGELRLAVEDWQQMQDKMQEALQALEPNDKEECEFLRWLQTNHFIFLGYREYDLSPQKDRIPCTGLGILRDKEISNSFTQLAPQSPLILLNKTKARSNIHRPAHLDYIGIKRLNKEGIVTGELRFLGLYTSAAYHQLTAEIPIIRRKIKYVFDKARFRHGSHKHQALFYILETYPRDELFQIEPETLWQTAIGILQLQERQQPIRLFVRADTYGRFFSCLVYVQRERYDTEMRQRMETVLLKAFGGTSIEFNVWLSESVFAQIHFIVYTSTSIDCDFKQIENQLIEITREWQDVLHDALLEHNGEEHGTQLFSRYEKAFPVAYREDFSATTAVYDIEKIEQVIETGQLGMSLYRPIEANSIRFKIFHAQNHIPLSQILPMLENMGVKVISERAYEITPIWIQEFGLLHDEQSLDINQIKALFQDVFVRLWRGEIENDGFNRLALRAHLTWREILIFRAYWKYLRQTGGNFSQKYVEQALLNNPTIAKTLLDLFYARCNPAQDKTTNNYHALIEKSLDSVKSLDEDRILRLFLGAILATLRTNYFQDKPYLSFKFDPSKVPDLPKPRPLFEIFVYSTKVEGVHLRGGKVARGGLRWSDRLEDYRTEILGLLKAQMVKNAVIVPVGAKGGFVAKQAEGIECYKTFIRGLLDITDNLIEGQIVPPPNVVRHDDDDPYLVVAADKGTATFSDIANEIAKDFWLNDAFASGGSSGYDHKKMGITARGAWESVKRHFREMQVNIQTQEISVIGIGDMSGDVFGNGLLLSQHIKLLAAFNHRHIFLDPNPQKSWEERQRLFNLPRSTWADYNPKLISQGGGVFSRNSKSIRISPQVQTMLGIQAKSLKPNELIQAILCAPVDLLWNGGIGTYVKAQTEHHAEVGDKNNDAVRVNGQELRCKVVGEGGNLGFTQRGRIEYAQNGGRINTDALDNSGGVDCSDHEVNIKILLNAIGDMTNKQRNLMLAEMTEQVSELVLKNNYLQTQAISIPLSISPQMFDLHARFLRHLEKQGQIDRELEFLPNNKILAERRTAQQGFTSPELCILLAYSKISLYQALLGSDLPENPYFRSILEKYFPSPLPTRFAEEIAQHRLHREIITTQLTNLVINRGGIAFVYMLEEETGQTAPEIVSAFMIAWEIFDIEKLCLDIEALDNEINSQVQLKMIMSARQQIERASRWLLRHHRMPIAKTIETLRPGVIQLAESLIEDAEQLKVLREAGVPSELATRVARLEISLSALDIVEVANATAVTLEHVAAVHFLLGARLKLYWLRDQINQLPRNNRWTALSRSALRDELYRTHRELTTLVLQTNNNTAEDQVNAWMTKNATRISRYQEIISEISQVEKPYLAMLSVGLREIRNLL
ncbi:NAD-glutamate dehydrogenase [Candidatus Thiomargarita nelsonii]|uniref:NAD-glutamate dehydrogenase n=1 Tax=Candidatus Thiomargarita nelsonii TaxID=1003181 RepID=A0A0A6PF40_9GAMM|nr:NAD-glutamate dehydrogenase [Candidatus Thiomargarita nelsonii]